MAQQITAQPSAVSRQSRLSIAQLPLTGRAFVPGDPRPRAGSPRLLRSDEAHQMTLRIREVADLDVGSRDRVGPHPAGPAEGLGPLERLLDVGHADVEGDVTIVALHAATDPSRDSDSVA